MSLLDRIFPWLGHARYYATPPDGPVLDSAVLPLRADATGALVVTTLSEAAVTYTQHAATAAHSTVRAAPGNLAALYATNLSEDVVAFQLFNLASSPPAPGQVPQHVFAVAPGAVLSIEALGGLAFSTGITWALSGNPLVYAPMEDAAAHVIAKHRAALARLAARAASSSDSASCAPTERNRRPSIVRGGATFPLSEALMRITSNVNVDFSYPEGSEGVSIERYGGIRGTGDVTRRNQGHTLTMENVSVSDVGNAAMLIAWRHADRVFSDSVGS